MTRRACVHCSPAPSSVQLFLNDLQIYLFSRVAVFREVDKGRNQLSVRLELQADCLAGVWGHSTEQRNILEAGDVEDALRAASAVGDDRLQRMETGRVNPDSFTHGTSQQRAHWFNQGFQSGDSAACDTFAQ